MKTGLLGPGRGRTLAGTDRTLAQPQGPVPWPQALAGPGPTDGGRDDGGGRIKYHVRAPPSLRCSAVQLLCVCLHSYCLSVPVQDASSLGMMG